MLCDELSKGRLAGEPCRLEVDRAGGEQRAESDPEAQQIGL